MDLAAGIGKRIEIKVGMYYYYIPWNFPFFEDEESISTIIKNGRLPALIQLKREVKRYEFEEVARCDIIPNPHDSPIYLLIFEDFCIKKNNSQIHILRDAGYTGSLFYIDSDVVNKELDDFIWSDITDIETIESFKLKLIIKFKGKYLIRSRDVLLLYTKGSSIHRG